jgi:hypothetical protein
LPHLDAGVMEVVRIKWDFHKVLLSRLISRQIWLINVVNGHLSTYLTKLLKSNPGSSYRIIKSSEGSQELVASFAGKSACARLYKVL